MVVAFDKGMEELRKKIDDMGFNTVVCGEYKGAADALVYYKNIDYMNDFSAENSRNFIDAYNKSADEIAEILKNSSYSSLI